MGNKSTHHQGYHLGRLVLYIFLLCSLITGCQADLTTPAETPTSVPSTSLPSDTVKTPEGVAPILSITHVASIGKGIVHTIVETPDKQHLLYGDGNNERIHVINASTLEEEILFEDACNAFRIGITISPDSRYMTHWCGIGHQLLDIQEWRSLGFARGEDQYSIGSPSEFSNDSQFLAFEIEGPSPGGTSTYAIGIWDMKSNSLYNTYEIDEDTTLYDQFSAPKIDPHNRSIAIAYANDQHSYILIWDVQSTKIIQKIPTPVETNAVDFSPDGATIASADEGGMLHLWDTETGQETRVIGGFRDSLRSIQYLDSSHIKVRVFQESGLDEYVIVDLSKGVIASDPVENEISPLEKKLFTEGLLINGPWDDSKVAISPDGSLVSQYKVRIALYETESRQARHLINPFSGREIRSLVFSGDGTRMAAFSEILEVAVWDTTSGEEIHRSTFAGGLEGRNVIGSELTIGTSELELIALSPDGNRMTSGDGNNISVTDLISGEVRHSSQPESYDRYISHIEYSTDRSRIYTILNLNQAVQVWDAEKLSLQDIIQLPPGDEPGYVKAVLAWPYLARDNMNHGKHWVELWNLETHSYQQLITDFQSIRPFFFGSDGQILYAYYKDALYSWRTSDGRLVGHTTGSPETSNYAISQDGNFLASVSDGVINIDDTSAFLQTLELVDPTLPAPTILTPEVIPGDSGGEGLATVFALEDMTASKAHFIPPTMISAENASWVAEAGHFSPGKINSIRWEADGSRLLISSGRSLSSMDKRGEINMLAERNASFTGSATRADGHLLSCGLIGNQVFVFDVTDNEILITLAGGGQPALSSDGKFLVYETPDRNLITYDVENHHKQAYLLNVNPSYFITDKALPSFSPDGRLVAGVQDGRIVRIWNTDNGTIYNALGGPDAPIADLSFSQDGRYLVAAGAGSAWMWETKPGGRMWQYEFYKGEINGNLIIYKDTVTAAGISPDNRFFALGTSRHDIHLYNLDTGNLILTLSEHSAPVTHLIFDPGSQYLLSADRDGRMILWNIAKGTPILQNNTFTGSVTGLVNRDDGNISAWGENTVWIITPASATQVSAVSTTVGRLLSASPDGKLLAVYLPKKVYLADAVSGKRLTPLEGEAVDMFIDGVWEGDTLTQFHGARFSPNSHLLATYGTGGLWLHTIADNSAILTHRFEVAYFTTEAAFSPDNHFIFFSPNEYRRPGQNTTCLTVTASGR